MFVLAQFARSLCEDFKPLPDAIKRSLRGRRSVCIFNEMSEPCRSVYGLKRRYNLHTSAMGCCFLIKISTLFFYPFVCFTKGLCKNVL